MYLYAACGDELRCLPVVFTLGSLDTEVAFRWGEAADMVRFAFSSEKCIYAIDSLEFSLPPSLFPPNSQAHRLGLERSSLNPWFCLPSIHPSLLPSSLPSPRTVCSNSEERKDAAGSSGLGWGGIRHSQTAQTLLQGMFGVDSPTQPSPSPTLPSAPRAVRLCWGKAAVQIGRHWSKDAALRSIGVIYVIVKAGRRGGRQKKQNKKEVPWYFSALKAPLALFEPPTLMSCCRVVRGGSVCVCMFTFGSVLKPGVRTGSPIFQGKVGLPPTKSEKRNAFDCNLSDKSVS